MVSRLAPFVAVCLANGLNTGLMRSEELNNGIVVTDENGNPLGQSKLAARKAIGQDSLKIKYKKINNDTN